jgi:hypothetical protein
MSKKFLFLTSFVLVLSLAYAGYGVEPNAPKPNPTWNVPPTTMGPYTVTMTASTVTDGETPPVQYLFECTTDATRSSAWQVSPTYTVTGLDPCTWYSFRHHARDSYSPPNVQATWSQTIPVKTDAATTPPVIRLDINNTADNNEPNTQVGFAPFVIAYSGKEANDINGNPSGVVVDLGGSITSTRRADPCGTWSGAGTPTDPCVYYPRAGERIYRDFISGTPPSGVEITLWDLGVNRDCNITIWAFDSQSTGDVNRVAKWYANGTYIFDTNFVGGAGYYPSYIAVINGWKDLYKYAFKGRATTDYLGRIILTSTKGPSSPADQPFAFVNALMVEPNSLQAFTPTNYAHRPQPASGGTACVPVNTVLKWRNGADVVTHDLYLDTDFSDVNDANRASHPGVVIYAPDLAADANQGYDPCDAAGFLALDKTYYWRVDENTPPNIYKGVEVWSFTTCPNSVVDNFDSYEDNAALQNVWQNNGTSAEVSVETTIARSGKSMRYDYKNDLMPYYSEARATIGTEAGELNIDPNWLGMGAKALVLWFYGQAGNPTAEQMYVKLTDGDSNFGTVIYGDQPDEDLDNVKDANWHEWNIDLALFDACGVNLADVNTIIIGFGDGTQAASDGTVYFEDIQLYVTRCVLAKRSADFARVDYAPLDIDNHPGGDCRVDYQELEIMVEYWLDVWDPWWTPPSDFVAYWPMNEGTGNKIFTDPCNPLYTGTFSPSGVTWATPGQPDRGGAHALCFDGNIGTRVSCGSADLGIGPTPPDVNAMTLSVWAKWLGLRFWDHYLDDKSQGLISKANGWAEPNMIFMFEVSNYLRGGSCYGSFGLRHYITGSNDVPDLYAPTGILTPFIGHWIHIAATYPHPSGNPADGNSYARLYLNGVEVASGPWRFSHGDPNATDLTIGNNWGEACWPDSPESFYGYLDEARIYKRVLTPIEIALLAGREPPCDLYSGECPWGWECPKVINFKDFVVLMNYWLKEELWP